MNKKPKFTKAYLCPKCDNYAIHKWASEYKPYCLVCGYTPKVKRSKK